MSDERLAALLTRVYQLGGLGARAGELAAAALEGEAGAGTTCVDGGARVLVRASTRGDVRVGVRVGDGVWRFVGAGGVSEVHLAGAGATWTAEVGGDGAAWSLAPRSDPVTHLVGALGDGWAPLVPAFSALLRVPEDRFRWAGRWALGQGPSYAIVGTSGWARLPDDAEKARALADVARRFGGDDALAALHDLLAREARVRRVGRAVWMGGGALGAVWVVG